VKRFIIASLIFLIISMACISFDAWMAIGGLWEDAPNLIYYFFGWLAAGIYIAIADGKKE
jgi:hypothetical protein